MDIVIDFDGTCVTHDFPEIGMGIGSESVLKELVSAGHNLILFTMRSDVKMPYFKSPDTITETGNYLTDAVNWFKENEIPLYGIQRNPTQDTWTSSPKAYGQIIIDDAALGCPLTLSFNGNANYHNRPFVDWVAVRSCLVQMDVL